MHSIYTSIKELFFRSFDNTRVARLPTAGLDQLILLNAHNVPNMLRFPKLESLQKAVLTYPYHCCALMDYGFGSVFENSKQENKILVNCETGEELSVIDDGKWINESTHDFYDSNLSSTWDQLSWDNDDDETSNGENIFLIFIFDFQFQ